MLEGRGMCDVCPEAQRKSYHALTEALKQSFAPKELVHLYQAELKARKKKTDGSMVDLGRDMVKLVSWNGGCTQCVVCLISAIVYKKVP